MRAFTNIKPLVAFCRGYRGHIRMHVQDKVIDPPAGQCCSIRSARFGTMWKLLR